MDHATYRPGLVKLYPWEIERVNIIRVAQDLKKFPDEVMRWMGYPEWAVESSAQWTYVVYQDVVAADRAIAEFQQQKAKQLAAARRRRGR